MRIRVGCLLLVLAAGGLETALPIPAMAQDQPAPNPARKGRPAAKKPAKPASAKPAPAPPPAPVVLPEPPLPTQQARKLELTQSCTDLVDQMSRGALNSKYDVQSGWNRQAPSQHVFQSVAVIDRPEVTPANGLAAVIATPTPTGSCDGVSVQVFPLASDCATAQTYMRSTGASAIPILNTQIMIDRNGKRIFLLPGVNKTCIAVSIDSSFGALPAGPAASGQAAPVQAAPALPSAASPSPAPEPGATTILPHAVPITPPSSDILPTNQPPK